MNFYFRFLLAFSFLRLFQLMKLMSNKGNRQTGTISNGLNPFSMVRKRSAQKRRTSVHISIMVITFNVFSFFMSSSSV
ncbi:hypothetical protein IW15_06650 [Chryseobacterium soli]|uniref:Uncharacterized protein n=1 Tax=Chryseobacterium soli TaxID=445961 RepID=A0A086A9V2_9FLAO|nr:hypothetical protein IW15_06650 [Chryseobacterium soli]